MQRHDGLALAWLMSLASANVASSEDPMRLAVQTGGACPPDASTLAPLDALLDAGRHPLCQEPKPDAAHAIVVRSTTFYYSSPMEITYRARRGHVDIAVDDEAFNYRFRYEQRVPIRGARFLELLRGAGIDAMWTEADPDCEPEIEKIYEINTVWEFLGEQGYRARWGPIAQDCVTPYRESVKSVGRLLMDLKDVAVAKGRRSGQ